MPPERSPKAPVCGSRRPPRYEIADGAFHAAPFDVLDGAQAACGDVFTIDLGSADPDLTDVNGAWCFVTDPALLRTVHTAPARVLAAGRANRVLFGPMLRPGCSLALDGADHVARRRILTRAYTRDLGRAGVTLLVEALTSALAPFRDGAPFSLLPVMQAAALEGAMIAAFGTVDDELRAASTAALRTESATVTNAEMAALFETLFGVIYARVAAARQGEPAGGLLARLVDAPEADGGPLGDVEVCEELLLNVIAGFHTTAATLAWTLAYTLAEPEVEARLREGAIAGDPVWRDATVRETLRLAPMMATNGIRLSLEPFALGGFEIAAGTVLAHSAYLLHRRADLYDDPERFAPERFTASDPPALGWAPFGGGARRCVGMNFALAEIGALVDAFLASGRYRLSTPSLTPVREGTFYVPEGGPMVERIGDAP